MALRWRYENSDGVPVPGPEVRFAQQDDAEEWLGRQWPALLGEGVDQVTLIGGPDAGEGDGVAGAAEVIYGPMSLRPADPD